MRITLRSSLDSQASFLKFIEAANNFIKLEVRKNFAKFVGLADNFYEVHGSCKQLCKVSRSEKKFTKFIKFVNNFTKFANSFWKVRKICKNLLKCLDWKVGFKSFLCFSFTRSNIFCAKLKCFVNTFHVLWILFTNKLNRCYTRVDKIFGTVKRWSLVALDRWSFYVV